ncbi:hypothetical protein RFX25_00125, partial [Acinetobacter baumannii]|nr:hypothetical protein [Acinetobacter baumannii]
DIPCDLLVQRSKEYGVSRANFWDKRKKLPVQLQQMKDLMIKTRCRIFGSGNGRVGDESRVVITLDFQ